MCALPPLEATRVFPCGPPFWTLLALSQSSSSPAAQPMLDIPCFWHFTHFGVCVMMACNFSLPFSGEHGRWGPNPFRKYHLSYLLLNARLPQNRHWKDRTLGIWAQLSWGPLAWGLSWGHSRAVSQVTSHPRFPGTVPGLAPRDSSSGKLLSLR